mmetsp:Transcript_27084/g.45139  ORF Transcript_27084/g.45139 Transcript_27084/m.45139 type:complete len:193 (+) Transcript_27084:303-881(+)
MGFCLFFLFATMKCSLWLMPPSPVATDVTALIHELSKGRSEIPFEAHVTIAGGIVLEEDPAQLCERLQTSLRGKFGKGIDCQFRPKALSVRKEDGTAQWNQALVAVLDQTPSLLALVDASRKALKQPPELRFAPLLHQPHLSLFYGTKNVPDPECVKLLEPFVATELALWSTTPGTAEGVANWKELGRISLV